MREALSGIAIAALAGACQGGGGRGGVTADAGIDLGADGGDATATIDGSDDATSSETAGACPAEIAPCIDALHALKAGCPDDSACMAQDAFDSTGNITANYCYANGVRAYVDGFTFTVIKPDGHICYTVQTDFGSSTETDTVTDPNGDVVLAVTRLDNSSYASFTCGSSYADLADSDQSCGDVGPFLVRLQCTDCTNTTATCCLRP